MDEIRPGNDATTALYGIMRNTEIVPLPRVSPAQRFYRSVGFRDAEVYDEFLEMKLILIFR